MSRQFRREVKRLGGSTSPAKSRMATLWRMALATAVAPACYAVRLFAAAVPPPLSTGITERHGRLAGLRNEHLLADEPDGPALRGQGRPQPGGAVQTEVELALPGRAVDGPDRRSASVTCLVHVAPPAA